VSQFVLDATITMAWCFTDEATEFTETLLSRLSDLTDRALVPALWLYEVVNVVELAVRKSRITEEKAGAFLESLADLPIEIENPTRPLVFASVRALASRYKLTGYDAAYLEVAIRHNLPMAALDNALPQAARAAGINLVQL
jgi:predicted nucleic acid-binding protein